MEDVEALAILFFCFVMGGIATFLWFREDIVRGRKASNQMFGNKPYE